MTGGEGPEEWLRVRILPMRQLCGNCDTTRRLSPEDGLPAKGASLVLRIGVLGGRLPSRDQQPGELDLRILRLSFHERDQKFPFIAIVEEESHLGPDQRKGLDDACPLDAPCVPLALSDIDKELIPDGRIVNVPLELVLEAERVVEIEGADCTCDLDVPIDFRPQRSAKNEGLGLSHSGHFSNA